MIGFQTYHMGTKGNEGYGTVVRQCDSTSSDNNDNNDKSSHDNGIRV